ncbi:universal stress protein [Microbacterium sp. X-17]|uniref:universal stress protein n=1 Tax=Microbacterium sp. X-17 TaxID=3144404 RepID=UPI0031F4EBE1
MSDSIVVGVTGTPAARRAVDWAVARAASRGQDVVLLTVVGGAIGAVGEAEVLATAVAAAESVVAAEADRVRAEGVTVTARASHGNPTTELIDAAKDAALLVIASEPREHGRRNGPHGPHVVAGARCTVVVVPDVDIEGRHGIVVGIDGSDVSKKAIEFAAAEADRLGEPLIAVSAWSPVVVPGDLTMYPDMYVADLESATKGLVEGMTEGIRATYPDLEIVTRVEDGDPASVINDIAATARLAVVGTHGRTGFTRFLLGSTSEQVLQHLVTVTAVVR